MMRTLWFVIFGYLSGSILYARVFGRWLKKEDIFKETKDQNPGTANAFMQGGFLCGMLTLSGDLLKGFLPVFLYLSSNPDVMLRDPGLSLVMAAPVLGHIFPVFFGFHGGKGIAVTFGSLLGLLPMARPVLFLAAFFVFFSLILKVAPHFYRTIATYLAALVCMIFVLRDAAVSAGFFLITGLVIYRMHKSSEKRENMRISLLWMH